MRFGHFVMRQCKYSTHDNYMNKKTETLYFAKSIPYFCHIHFSPVSMSNHILVLSLIRLRPAAL